MSGEGRTRLTSWKEIASHLRREVRTVIRWEKERGLPVHRVPGGKGRSVFAYTDELDAWAAGRSAEDPPAESPRPSRFPFAAVAAIAVAAGALAGALVYGWPRGDVASIDVSLKEIRALADTGRTVWSYPLPGEASPVLRRHSQIVDLDGDGHPDVVAGVNVTARRGGPSVGALIAIDRGGRTLWQQSLDSHLVFGGGAFDPPWESDDVNVIRAGETPLVTWTVHHYTWWPSQLTVFRADGRKVGTFVNSGWIRSAEPTPDGRYVIAGGFSNSRNAASFAVLDPDNPEGASPEDPGSAYECLNCPRGTPLRYITVQWTDVASALPQDERDVTIVVSPSGGVQLRVQQRRSTEAIVELSRALEVTRATFSDNFWDVHQRLEAAGALTHARDRCPFRNGPIVREWTRAAGWRDELFRRR